LLPKKPEKKITTKEKYRLKERAEIIEMINIIIRHLEYFSGSDLFSDGELNRGKILIAKKIRDEIEKRN